MRRSAALLAGLSLAGGALLGGCTGGSDADPAQESPAAPAATEPMSLDLLVFNVEYGGTPASDAVLADLDADVVGVLESYNRLPEIAAAADYPYYNVGLQILSKYPILEPSGADGLYAWIEIRPGEAVAMINTHLDYVQYGPDRLARGVPVADVLATEEEVRLSSIETLLPSAERLLGDGWPLLFTGDLNQPSHLDWTAETAAEHGGVGAVAWPVSEALAGAGLSDAYREVHPDPAAEAGTTWGGVADSKGLPDRIDYAYVGGPVEVESSEVVGERGGPGVDRGYAKWTSDHRAVLSTLTVEPVPIPTTVALSSRMVTVGDDVTVTYRMPEADGTVTLTGPVVRVVRRDRHVGHGRGPHRLTARRRVPRRPPQRRRRRGRHQRAATCGPPTRRWRSPPTPRRTPWVTRSPCTGPTARPTGGTGSASTPPTLPIPRRTATACGATPAATTPGPCRRAPRATSSSDATIRAGHGRCRPVGTSCTTCPPTST